MHLAFLLSARGELLRGTVRRGRHGSASRRWRSPIATASPGIVRAHEAAKATGVRLIVGCRLDLTDGMGVLVYPMDRPAYARLCRLLSLGKKRGGKAHCRLDWSDVIAYGEGLIAVLIPDEADAACALHLRRLAEAFGDRASLALTLRRRPNDALRLHELSNLAGAGACANRRHQ